MTQEAAAPTLREAPTGRDMFLAYYGKADAGVWDRLLPTTREAWERCAALAARPADPAEPTTLPSSRERWNAENPGELSLHTFDDDATPAEPSVRAALEEWDASAHPAVPPSSSPGPAGLQSAGASEVEIRLNDDGTLDEVVGGEGIHLEQMDTNHWWMAVYYPGGRVTVGFHARGKITANVERERDSAREPESAKP